MVWLSAAPAPGTPATGARAVFHPYLAGLKYHAPLALLLLAGTFAVHILGLIDDRRALAPWPKLLGQLAIAGGLVLAGEAYQTGAFRVLTLLGNFPSPGFWASCLVSMLWIVALTNAFNFLDNMDGLSAGVAFIAATLFLVAACLAGQWFICGLLLVFMGSVLGFLCFNFPPASIFMGDGGSMVLGFFLSALTIRTTYVPPGQAAEKWYALFMPLIVMAVPLYDLVLVSVLRIAQGHSPMTGDTNHFSHRLVRHGFSKPKAVLVIYGLTLAMGISAPLLTRVDSVGAVMIACQCVAMLVVIGVLERVGEHTSFARQAPGAGTTSSAGHQETKSEQEKTRRDGQ
jgi:UDP-GlcNAc:undecaprenyl-phosphate GlcNAc-1-phosphate transferase